MTLTRDKIEQLAPDQASLSAANKLLKPANWPVVAKSDDGALLWGECQGSGATPYRVVISPADAGYKCTCPSRKFPCKHSLAVMLMSCDAAPRFTLAETPDWVIDWLSRRRGKTAPANPKVEAAAPKAARSLDAALAETAAEVETPGDPKAAARAQAQRLRLAENREAAILSGLDELERWISDELNVGLAGFAQRAVQSTKTLSTRLVDCKAQALAARLDTLALDIFRYPEHDRSDRVAGRMAALQLIASAYRCRDDLPAPLKEDVRRAVGWTVKRDELLSDPLAPRVSSNWIVAATRSEIQPDKLRRLETWLLDAAPSEGAPRFALLVEFVPVSAGASGLPFAAGEVIAGEVVFYPSAAPLRALMATRTSASDATPWPKLPESLDGALGEYEAALARQPWLEFWPLAAGGLAVKQSGSAHLVLADTAGLALPLDPRQAETVLPLMGLDAIDAAFIWDGSVATLLAAQTPAGPWHES